MSRLKFDLIIFFVPPTKFIGGGIISIFSLCEETRRLKSLHEANVVICTYPGYASYKKNDLFDNNEIVFDFDYVTKRYKHIKNLLVHIPENDVSMVYEGMSKYRNYFNSLSVHVNILNQNIQLMPSDFQIAQLYEFSDHITQTTAHNRYATQATADRYGMPVHLFSVYINPNNYTRTTFKDKENIIAVSPDEHPQRELVINKLSSLSNYKIVEIRNLSYEEYKATMAAAKFSITFGEGFDGYYIESTFSGGIGFSVFNSDFFPDDSFLTLDNIYASYDEMLDRIVQDIKLLDSKNKFSKLNDLNYAKLSKIYNYESYKNNLVNFYKGRIDYQPRPLSLEKFFIRAIRQATDIQENNLKTIYTLDTQIKENLHKFDEVNTLLTKKEDEIAAIYNSLSWKITKPLRYLSKKLKS